MVLYSYKYCIERKTVGINGGIKMKLFRKLACCIVMSMVLCAFPAYAASPPDTGGPKNAENFEKFTDMFMKTAMDKYHVPGAVVVVVKDGKVFFKKGYGYGEVDKRLLIDPDRTVFRTGSVSKLFTATAVMQLAEQGMIDLNTDINKYLKDFKIESKYKKPVTMENLLTHTAGFDEAIIGMQFKDLSAPVPLGKYLKGNMPPVIREPGTVIQYSNHGMALAGYIVESVSGMPFDKYIEQNILMPLNMERSSFLLSKEILSNMAVGYTYSGNKYIPIKPFNINLSPAGSFNTTADDMSRFLIAHLQKGKYNNKRILLENTIVDMQAQHFSSCEGMLGYAYGFCENMRNGLRVIEHGGAITPFMSLVSLLPEKNVGFFISTSSEGGGKLFEEYANEFYKYYKADDRTVPAFAESSDIKTESKSFEGTYTAARRPRTNLLKFISLLSSGNNIVVRDDGKGKLILEIGKEKRNLVQISDNLFRDMGDDTYYAFKKDSKGNTFMVPGDNPKKTYEKLKWHENMSFHKIFLLVNLIIFLIGCIIWIAVVSRRSKTKYKGPQRRAMILSGFACLLNLLFVIGFFIYFLNNYALAVTPYLRMVLCIPVVSIILTGNMIVFTVQAWRKGYWKTAGRIYYTMVTFAAAGFIVFLKYFNLIGFKF